MVNELTDAEKEAILKELRKEELRRDSRIMFVSREPFIEVHEMMAKKDLYNETEALEYMLIAVDIVDALRAPLTDVGEQMRLMDINKRFRVNNQFKMKS
jgi:hypothetical protein